MNQEELKDIVIECKDCHQEFVFSVRDQLFYKEQGFEHQPVRCRECRNKRKQERAARNNNNESTSTEA